MTHIASDGSNQSLLVASGTLVPGTDAQTYTASDGTLQEALPVDGASGGTGPAGPVEWDDVQNKPATFTPTIGSTNTTAKAGDYEPAWDDVTDKPATFPPIIGTTSTTAKAGDYEPEWDDINGKPAVIAAGSSAAAARAVIEAIGTDQKGIPNGVAPLDASGLVPLEHLNVSGLTFAGAWNAATNTPTLLDGTGTVGMFYKVSAPGTYNFGNGEYVFSEGDWVMYAAGVWQRIGVHEAVTSVNGKTGMITLTAADVGALPSDYSSPVASVNGKTGTVVLTAADVGALPSGYTAPVTSVNGKSGAVTIDPSEVGAVPFRYVHVQDQKPAGGAAGQFDSGAWRTRTLNTVVANTIPGASLSSNSVTLPAGTYRVDALAASYYVGSHRLRLLVNSTQRLLGVSSWSSSLQLNSYTYLRGVITLTSTSTVTLQHRCSSTSTNGFGPNSANYDGLNEVFADLMIEKVI